MGFVQTDGSLLLFPSITPEGQRLVVNPSAKFKSSLSFVRRALVGNRRYLNILRICHSKIGHAARTMATLNNLVLALILRQAYACLPQTRRRYAARPLEALQLIMQNPYQ